jgi:hypothetical protein
MQPFAGHIGEHFVGISCKCGANRQTGRPDTPYPRKHGHLENEATDGSCGDSSFAFPIVTMETRMTAAKRLCRHCLL